MRLGETLVATPLHHATHGPPPPASRGEDFKGSHHSAASAKVSPWSSSAEQRCIVSLARAIALVR